MTINAITPQKTIIRFWAGVCAAGLRTVCGTFATGMDVYPTVSCWNTSIA